MKRKQAALLLVFLLFVTALYLLGNHVPRSSFFASLTLYSILFAGYLLIYRLFDASWISVKNILLMAIVSRMVLIGAVPQLSDDYSRFIWDGHLIINKIDPYQYTPSAVLEVLPPEKLPFFQSLYEDLNSPEYYSIYPITNQAVFALAAFVGQERVLWNIYVIRIILLIFECLVICSLFRLIKLLKVPPKRILLYALNPLVLIEITGNLHFEGIMLSFLLIALILITKKKIAGAGGFFGLSVAVKLTPLILIPAFVAFLRKKLSVRFGISAFLVVGTLFLPIVLVGSVGQFFQSIRLYHGIFEFNASIYYALRQIGIWVFENNPVRILGPALSLLTVYIIVRHFWKAEKLALPTLLEGIVYSYLIYYLFNTVVHPWYLITGLGLSILTNKNAFLVWSYLVFLSYFAYSTPAYEESMILLSLEYLGLLAAVAYDFRKGRTPGMGEKANPERSF